MRRLFLVLMMGLIARTAWAQSTGTQSPTPTVAETATQTLTLTPSRTPSPTPTFMPTDTPSVAGFAIDSVGDVLFPEAIRFTVTLSRPVSELESTRLTVETEAQDAQTLDLDAAGITQTAEPEAVLTYVWPIPEEAVPPLFSSVRYIWEIEAVDGEMALTEGTVMFTDPRAIWDHYREADGHLNIALARGLSAGVVGELVNVYDLLSSNTGSTPELAFMLYDESQAPGCEIRSEPGRREEPAAVSPLSGASVPCRLDFAEQVYEQGGYVPFQRLPGEDVETAMVERMVLTFYDPLWSGNAPPQWFRVGLGLMYVPALKTDYLPISQALARGNRLFPLEVMNSVPPTDAEVSAAWRAQSYGMVLYITELVGLDGVFSLANIIGDGQPFVDTLEQMTGQPVDSLIAAWQGWLFTDAAVTAYGITPYQPSTPTSGPTSTETSTRIPSSTATMMPSPAPSVTGVLSPTPYPTLTPTRTPLPEPPTVTPRPPLRTPTPPPSSFAFSLTPTTQIVVAALLSIVIGILVVVYIRLGRR
jgi:hypothetical protein